MGTEDHENADDGRPWPGLTCTSWLWQYTPDQAKFEARRAIANLTGGLRHTYSAVDYEPGDKHAILLNLESAHTIHKAANDTLQEIVAEAVSNGATWREVGDRLGIGKTAAHKRFSPGLSSERLAELDIDYNLSTLILMQWTERLPSKSLGFDEEDWEAAPPNVSLAYSLRMLGNAPKRIRSLFDFPDDENERFVFELWKTFETIRNMIRIFMHPYSMKLIRDARSEKIEKYPWMDVNPGVYFVQAIHLTLRSFHYLGEAITGNSADGKDFIRYIIRAYYYLCEASALTARPECLEILITLEEEAEATGHTAYEYTEPRRDNLDEEEFFTAVWRKDKKRLARLLNIEDLAETPTLAELLAVVDSEGFDED